MDNLPKLEKPYRFDTIVKSVTATDYAMWEYTLGLPEIDKKL